MDVYIGGNEHGMYPVSNFKIYCGIDKLQMQPLQARQGV